MEVLLLLQVGVVLALLGFGLRWFFAPILWSWRDPVPLSYTHQLKRGPDDDAPGLFPSLFEEPSLYMSIIIPAYNEGVVSFSACSCCI